MSLEFLHAVPAMWSVLVDGLHVQVRSLNVYYRLRRRVMKPLKSHQQKGLWKISPSECSQVLRKKRTTKLWLQVKLISTQRGLAPKLSTKKASVQHLLPPVTWGRFDLWGRFHTCHRCILRARPLWYFCKLNGLLPSQFNGTALFSNGQIRFYVLCAHTPDIPAHKIWFQSWVPGMPLKF